MAGAEIGRRVGALAIRVSLMPGRYNISKHVRGRPSQGITLKGMNSSWEGEVANSIFELGSGRYVGLT